MIWTVDLLHFRWMTEYRTMLGCCIVGLWLPDAILESQGNWRTDGPTTSSWFYILRPACSLIAPGFCDCTRIAWGLWIASDAVFLVPVGLKWVWECIQSSLVLRWSELTDCDDRFVRSGLFTCSTVGGWQNLERCPVIVLWNGDCPMQSWNPSAMGERTGRRLPPGSIYSGPLVLPLRLDSMIAPGLRGDYGLCWAFDVGNEACGV